MSTTSSSSSSEKGIQWTTGLTWEQVKQKAKSENKYIFLDCYATWCGPCKLMDKYVYTADTVGDFYNEKFISVKVQMDRTVKDNDEIKRWHTDADSIKRKYHVEGYPTFLFFNPNGQITENKLGYKQVGEFIALGKSATEPGKLYNDPYADYDRKLVAYKDGERNYDAYPLMIRMADKLHDTTISKQLTKEFTNYVASLPPKERYTKERIEFWNKYTWLSNTKVFSFFYKDAKFINKAMDDKAYAQNFIDKTINYEIVFPFLKEESKVSGIAMEGPYLSGPGLKPDYSEAKWGQLYSMISSKYGKAYARRNVFRARIEWYTRHRNKDGFIKYSLEYFNQYPPDMTDVKTAATINGPAWEAFLTSTDKTLLKGYAKWMKRVVESRPEDNFVDTYANLLYKLGHIKEAIKWQEKAVQLSPKDLSYFTTLQQMKNGERTYLDQGAKWNSNLE